MGTNYYLAKGVCPHCGRSDEQKHIGKSSAGWCFSLHVYPGEGIYDLGDWQRLLAAEDTKILDEYGHEISIKDLLDVIVNRKSKIGWSAGPPAGYDSEAHFHSVNFSERGPNGLLRHRIQQTRINDERQSFTNGCIAHGAGTWDCIVGEFS